ncbi:MAG: hypothetical protein AB7S78_02385 [Candidatus Omnitrophota bacterium]
MSIPPTILRSINKYTRGLIPIFMLATCFGCTTLVSYETIIRKANTLNLQDGLDKEEAVLVAQKHVILSGLDQDVSVRRVGEVKLMEDQNFWLVTFNDSVDNKIGERRHEPPQKVVIQVNRTTGTSALFSN